ncbi:hypothetical protein SLE2022_369590 [Rubroshorea leprosula]
MALISTQNPWLFVFGLLGNISSFVVFLAPLSTFYRIWKKKSTEGFHSIPYLTGLFSAMLWIYYALLKADAFLLITINAFGCVIETIYIAFYITYAPRKARIFTLTLLLLLNFMGFCSILLLSHFLTKALIRVDVLGWICMVFSLIVFVAPLSITRRVIRTKSVEYMPFNLSLYLTVSAVMWLFYGIFLKDMYVTIPNILGVIFGLLQMVLYAVYRNKSKMVVAAQSQSPQHSIDIAKLKTQLPNCNKNIENEEQKENDHQNIDQTGNITEVFNSNPKMASEV